MAGTHPQDIPPFVEDNNPLTPQNSSSTVAPQDHPTIKAELDNSTPVAPQGHTTIKAELDNSLPTSNIKAELDNSPPTPQNPSTPVPPPRSHHHQSRT